MATKEMTTKTLSVEQQIAELQKEGANLREAAESIAKSLNQPNYRVGDGTLSRFEDDDSPTIPGELRKLKGKYIKGYKGCREAGFDSFGEFLKSGYSQHKTAEWQDQHRSVYKAVQGMNTQSGEDGGFMIYPEFAEGILDRVYKNDLWSKTDSYSISGNSMTFQRNAETSRVNGSRHGGLRGYWLGEGATGTKSNPTTRQVTTRLKKLMVVVYLTEEMRQDGGPAIEQYVNRKASEEINFMLGDAVFNGIGGAGQPLGILNSGATVSVSKETGQTAATIVALNIDKMWARRYSGGSGGYAWYHNQDCGPQLDNLAQDVGTGGVPLYRPKDGIAGVSPQSLKTGARVETEFNATLGTVGDIVLADLGQYVTISKGGISQQASIHVEFLTDQTALRFTMRVDGRPWDDTPITPYKGTATQGCFLSLQTRS